MYRLDLDFDLDGSFFPVFPPLAFRVFLPERTACCERFLDIDTLLHSDLSQPRRNPITVQFRPR